MIWVCGRVSLVFVEGKVIDFDFVDAVYSSTTSSLALSWMLTLGCSLLYFNSPSLFTSTF